MARFTGKEHKNIGILRIFAALVGIAAVTTGATLCFVAADSSKSSDGGVAVEYVAGGSLRIDGLALDGTAVSSLTDGADFVFDSAAGDCEGRVRWDGVSGEKLEVVVSGTIVNAGELKSLSYTLTLPVGVTEAAKLGYVDISPYYDALTDSQKEIEIAFAPSEIYSGEDGAERLDFTFTVSLGWGEYFRGVNPSIYYDTVYYEDGAAEEDVGAYVPDGEMLETLDELRDILSDDGGYRIVITAEAD